MAKLKLKNDREVPQFGWRFPRDPQSERMDDAAMIFGGDFADLAAKVANYRIINSLPMGNVDEEIHEWLCHHSPVECVPVRPRGFTANILVRGAELARFVSAMTAWMTTSDLVSQEEAERRAEICAGCRLNVELGDVSCAGCYGLAGRILQIIGNRTTRMENSLRFCGHCHCSNAVQVFAPISILNRAHNVSEFPVDIGDGTPCWQKAAEAEA